MARTSKVWTPRIGILQFAKAYLQLDLYKWQRDVLLAVQAGYPSAALICNGGGKSSVLIPAIILWFLYNWPNGRCQVLSGTWKQIEDYVWPAINSFSHFPYFRDWEFQTTELKTGRGGFAKGLSPTDPKAAEGGHESDDSPLLFIVDEAKALEDRIIDAIIRCTSSFFLITSSAGSAEGRFYDCFNTLQQLFWRTKISSYDCPHITDEMRAWDLAYYRSESNPVYRSRHLSEFDQEKTGQIISASSLRRALAEPPAFVPGARTAFCDFAAGGNENVLAIAEGNKVYLAAMWVEKDTVQGYREFIRQFEIVRLTPGQIYGDRGGLGIGMLNDLAEAGWPITPVDNGVPALNTKAYANRGSEIWFEAAFAIDGKEWILPDDSLFFEQATSRRKQYDSQERLRAEPKSDMARRMPGKSPDRADAVFGAMVCGHVRAFSSEDIPAVEVGHSEFSRRQVSFR